MTRLMAAGLVLAACGASLADGPCVVRARFPVYYAPTYYAPYAAPVYVAPVEKVLVAQPVAFAVPAYSAVYGGPSQAEMQQLTGELQRLRQEVQQLRQAPQPQFQPGPVPAQGPPPEKGAQAPQQAPAGHHPALAVLTGKCAGCHEAAVSKGKGGGFTLLQGAAPVPLTEGQRFKVSMEVYSGRMPRGSKASDEDVGQIMDYLDKLK